jgi:hypothetical protein
MLIDSAFEGKDTDGLRRVAADEEGLGAGRRCRAVVDGVPRKVSAESESTMSGSSSFMLCPYTHVPPARPLR